MLWESEVGMLAGKTKGTLQLWNAALDVLVLGGSRTDLRVEVGCSYFD